MADLSGRTSLIARTSSTCPAGLTSEEAFREVPLRFFAKPSDPFVAHPFGLEGLEIAHRLLTAEVSDCQRPLLSRQAPREFPNARRASHDQINPFGDLIVDAGRRTLRRFL